jgi:hypothetical protein
MHSEKVEKVKYYFDTDRWSLFMVKNAVKKSWITEEEYTEITGLEY